MSCCAAFCGRTTEYSRGLPSMIICLPKTGTTLQIVPGQVVSELSPSSPGNISSPFVLQVLITTCGRRLPFTRSSSTHQYSAIRTVSEPTQPSPCFSASDHEREDISESL